MKLTINNEIYWDTKELADALDVTDYSVRRYINRYKVLQTTIIHRCHWIKESDALQFINVTKPSFKGGSGAPKKKDRKVKDAPVEPIESDVEICNVTEQMDPVAEPVIEPEPVVENEAVTLWPELNIEQRNTAFMILQNSGMEAAEQYVESLNGVSEEKQKALSKIAKFVNVIRH